MERIRFTVSHALTDTREVLMRVKARWQTRVEARVNRQLKIVLSRLGTRLPTELVASVRLSTGYLAAGRWLTDNGYDTSKTVTGRSGVFAIMSERVGARQTLYVELGVFQGASLRYWSKALTNPASELHGFDSFEGLPETFDDFYSKGKFDTGGKLPQIDDSRITYHVGWFETTLPEWVIPEHEVLVVVFDADLYSSTKLGLETLGAAIKPGCILYFDELSRVEHEPAAFADFISTTGHRFELLALEDTYNTAAFICTQ